MPQFINTNIASLDSQRNLNMSQLALQTSLQRLSSGLRVNSAKDDAAGLAIAQRMDSQVRGMNMAVRNTNDAISLVQTAEGALAKIGDSLQRMRELAVQSANATNNTSDRTNLNNEFAQLQTEVQRVATSTQFNGVSVLNNANTLTFQVGANNVAANDQIGVVLSNMTIGNVGTATGAGTLITTQAGARVAIDSVTAAIDTVTTTRATFGAMQNRFTQTIGNLQIASQNTSAAKSRIMDTDFAAETSSLARAQILQQAGTAMLAQANQSNNGVMALLR